MMIGFNSLPDSFFVKPAGRVGTGGADLSALFMDLVDRHLHEFSRHPLAAELIADIGVVDGVSGKVISARILPSSFLHLILWGSLVNSIFTSFS